MKQYLPLSTNKIINQKVYIMWIESGSSVRVIAPELQLSASQVANSIVSLAHNKFCEVNNILVAANDVPQRLWDSLRENRQKLFHARQDCEQGGFGNAVIKAQAALFEFGKIAGEMSKKD